MKQPSYHQTQWLRAMWSAVHRDELIKVPGPTRRVLERQGLVTAVVVAGVLRSRLTSAGKTYCSTTFGGLS